MVENFAKLCGGNQRVIFSKATTLLKTAPLPKWHNRRPFDKEAPPPKVARHFILHIYVSYSQDDDKKFATENAFRDVPLFKMRFK